MNAVQTTARPDFFGALAKGYSVIPLQPGSKRPLLRHLKDEKDNTIGTLEEDTAGWEYYQTERATPETVQRWLQKWPNANMGIVTGAISDIIVIDVDREHGGDETLEKLESLGHKLPLYKVVKTPHGRHFYYGHPGPEFRVPNKNPWKAGIDVRGDGGYVVAPGSVVDGIVYEDLGNITTVMQALAS